MVSLKRSHKLINSNLHTEQLQPVSDFCLFPPLVQYLLPSQSIVPPLLLSLLPCCQSSWSACICTLAESKDRADKREHKHLLEPLHCPAYSVNATWWIFLVKVKRASATDSASPARSEGFLTSCICFIYGLRTAYYVAQAVPVPSGRQWEGSQGGQLKPLLPGDACHEPQSSVEERAALFPPKGRCKPAAMLSAGHTDHWGHLGLFRVWHACIWFNQGCFKASKGEPSHPTEEDSAATQAVKSEDMELMSHQWFDSHWVTLCTIRHQWTKEYTMKK